MNRSLFFLLFITSLPTLLFADSREGERYRWLDSQAISVTVAFDEAVITAARDDKGRVAATLRAGDNEATCFIDEYSQVFVRLGRGQRDRRMAPFGDRPLLDQVAVEFYRIWRNERSVDTLRLETTAERRLPSSSHEKDSLAIREIVTKFPNGVAKARRHPAHNDSTPTMTAGYFASGSEAAIVMIRWLEQSQTLQWIQPDGFIGEVNADTIPGGWSFEPNPAWANLQAYSFVVSQGEHPTSILRKMQTLGAPATNAELDGCTGLHWLDGTIFRECCDEHDRCYIKEDPDCTALSWIFPRSWACLGCNIKVVLCFLTGGGGGIRDPYPFTMDPYDGSCWYTDGFICPAYCSYCK